MSDKFLESRVAKLKAMYILNFDRHCKFPPKE